MAETTGPEQVATAGPDKVPSADQIGLSHREAAAPLPPEAAPRDTASWARKVERLQVGPRDGVRGTNVAGRQIGRAHV